MNLLTYRKPSVIYRSDASEFSLGAYNVCSGAAWRFKLPTNCQLQTSLNALEFIACAITIWIDSLKGHISIRLAPQIKLLRKRRQSGSFVDSKTMS
jgi:hypothetical protein